MIYYLCPYCDKPAFFFRVRPKKDAIIVYQNIQTNGNWIPQKGCKIYCQVCMTVIPRLVIERVMTNLDYLESLYEKKHS
jgi:hypothetical protein